jgi:nitrogen fixation/metabolism regulation signal transduction histidine kinase
MGYKRFHLLLVIRLVILLGLMMLFSLLLFHTDRIFSILLIVLLMFLSIGELVRYISKLNRDLSNFINTIVSTDDLTSAAKKITGNRFEELHESFRQVSDAIQSSRIKEKSYYHFVEAILTSIETGVIIFKENNTLEFINRAALRITHRWKYDHPENKTELDSILNGIRAGEKKVIHETVRQSVNYYSVRCQLLRMGEQHYRIITLQNIRSEMEEQETEAWHKLIRTLAHEIMNSVTPITSLSESSMELLLETNGKVKTPNSLTQNDLERILQSLRTIEQRGTGLHEFVNQYRKLAHTPQPEFSSLTGDQLDNMAVNLMQVECNKQGIELEPKLTNGRIQLYGDLNLLEHVIINLIRNSIEALQGIPAGRIVISDLMFENSYALVITDNGIGIQSDDRDKVFIPFFSTKRNGSGIGLAVSRQIMLAHKGTLEFISEPLKKTSFYMVFPLPRT